MSTGPLLRIPDGQGDPFFGRQWAYFCDAEEAKFRWQTGAPVFAATERDLVLAAAGSGRFLEVGCGEGGNLFHLGPRQDLTVGLDYSRAKLGFAAGAVPWGRFVGGNALCLPFRDGAFDRVFCRDVLHHLPEERRRDAVVELVRVCSAGGEIVVIEANGRNPLIAALAMVTPAERGLFRSTPNRVAALVRGLTPALALAMAQPLPMARAVLHYRYGVPALGSRAWAACLFRRMDRIARCLVPRSLWAYVVIRARRAG